jgi:hypothetical protein
MRWHQIVLCVWLMCAVVGCQSSPTSPHAPMLSDGGELETALPPVDSAPRPSAASERIQLALPSTEPPYPGNFYAGPGYSDQFGVYYDGKRPVFQAQMPVGEYLLTYRTTLGTFYLVFRATANAILSIGLTDGDWVYEAVLYRGSVTAATAMHSAGPVSVYSEFGAQTGWERLFQRDRSPAVMLIGWIGVTYAPGQALTLTLPRPARYVFAYRTNLGAYRLEFRTTTFLEEVVIDLKPGEVVGEAYITMYDE